MSFGETLKAASPEMMRGTGFEPVGQARKDALPRLLTYHWAYKIASRAMNLRKSPRLGSDWQSRYRLRSWRVKDLIIDSAFARIDRACKEWLGWTGKRGFFDRMWAF